MLARRPRAPACCIIAARYVVMVVGNSDKGSGRRGGYASTRVGGTFWRTNSDSTLQRQHGRQHTAGWSSRAAAWQNYAVFFFCGMCLTYPWNAMGRYGRCRILPQGHFTIFVWSVLTIAIAARYSDRDTAATATV